jgi:hypothetical protein
VPESSILSPILYSVHINDIPQTSDVYLIFADDTYMYATDHKECYVLRKLQRSLNLIEAWCEHWNIKINEENTRAVYFSHLVRPPETRLTLNGRNILFPNLVKYLGPIFDKRITWRLHVEMM